MRGLIPSRPIRRLDPPTSVYEEIHYSFQFRIGYDHGRSGEWEINNYEQEYVMGWVKGLHDSGHVISHGKPMKPLLGVWF